MQISNLIRWAVPLGAVAMFSTAGCSGEAGPPGTACWDLNDNATCDPATEDTSGDGTCSAADCRGVDGGGVACWDLNENDTCDVMAEDADGDGACSVADCRGTGGPGTACWDINDNDTCDPATEDADGDGTCSAADCAGESLGTLSGTVTDGTDPLADVVVTLEPDVTGAALSTDAAGAFTGNLPIGSYMVTFELPGYASQTVLAGVAAGITTTLDIELVPYGDLVIHHPEEGCPTCHGPGRIADVAVIHPDPLPSMEASVTGITDAGGGHLTIAFHVQNADTGAAIAGIARGSNRIYLSDIVPAGTATRWGTWATASLERWGYEQSSTSRYTTIQTCTTTAECVTALGAGATCDGGPSTAPNTRCRVSYPIGAWTDLGGGNYTYTTATPLGGLLAMVEAPDYDATHTQRVVMRIANTGYSPTVAIQDFTVSGAAPALLTPQRVLAPTNGCQSCHGEVMNRAAHAGGYLDTRACAMCHSPIGHYGDEMQEDSAYSSVLFHRLHSAIPMEAFPDRIGGLGYGAVTFPQGVRNCETCHTGDTGMTDAWRTHPTVEACTSCHEDISFAATPPVGTVAHTGGPQANGTCNSCHNGTIASTVQVAHEIPVPAEDEPEFNVTLAISPPASGTFYVEGEAPTVTVTLTNASDGSPVNTAFYTSPMGAAGDTSDTALRVASVYVYGPRAEAQPVLATGTQHDPLHDPRTAPTQAHPMFMGGTDPLVETSATGFRYHMLPIPAGMEAGTYIVRVRIGDYGRVGSGDYHIESIARTTIQIGTATEELKVAGDACVGCHNTGNFLSHNERHSAVFNTDECLSCHDQSGNHAIPLANRLHAVHSANSDGDIYNIEGGARDHSDVTFPSNTIRCTTCHDSGNGTYLTNAFMMPCAGCHVEEGNGALGHMQSSGGPYPRAAH